MFRFVGRGFCICDHKYSNVKAASIISVGNYSQESAISILLTSKKFFSTSRIHTNTKNNLTTTQQLHTDSSTEYENHVPVLVKQCCELLRPSELKSTISEMTQRSNKHAKIGPNKKSTCIKKNDHEEQFIFIDATFGAGGYTTEILKMYPNSKVIGIDTDYYSNPIIQQHEKLIHDKFGKDRLEVYGVNFRNLKQLVTETILPKLDVKQKPIGSHVIDGIVFDLGVSSMQLDYGHRGFSFLRDGPLDMRMNPSDENCPTAREVVNNMSELDLRMIIAKFGEEENASKIAKSIVHYRNNVKPFDTTLELANLIESITPFKDRKKKKIHPATKTFQAIRIYVNDELGALATALDATRDVLKLGTGRLVVVSYHSLEDRIAKEFIKENNTYFKKVTKKLVTPDEEEIETNVRSRSAKLRCAQRTDVVDSNI